MNLSAPITDIMTINVVTVSPKQKLIDVKHIFEKEQFHHHIPVVDNGKLVGMISLVDYFYAIKSAGMNDDEKIYHEKTAEEIMSTNPFHKSIHSSIGDISKDLARGDFHAVVITDDNNLKGIVTTADIIRYFIK
jgi:acetoin utilization protein AcuB